MSDDVIPLTLSDPTASDLGVACERSVRGFASLLLATGNGVTTFGVCELLAGVPATVDGMKTLLATPDNTLFSRCISAFERFPKNGHNAAVADALSLLLYLPPERRELIDAAIRGVLLGYNLAR